MGIVYASILWFGGNLVAEGALQIGVVTAVVEYSMLTLAYLMIAAMVLVIIPKSFASLRRIEEILQAEIEIEEETIKTVAEPTFDQTNAAAFEHVTFKYTEISDPVLEDIDFTIPKGKTTAIVGGTGSGKSSLAKLLLRLSDPTIGKVTLGGIPLTQMTQEQIRSHISYVPQKAFLFSGTILSNLQMGNEYASTEELSKAIKIAQLEELVDTLPDGLDSFVAQGGSNYSGGQKQRICIARALIKPAEIYVFDDSFSALDYKTDAALRAALHKHMSEKTLVIVAQRLSTIQQADNIIVLDEGKSLDKVLMKNYCLIAKLIRSLQNHKEYRKKGYDGKEKTLNTRALIRFWKMIKPEHKYFYGLFLYSLFGNLLVVAMPLIMGIGIDDLLSEIRKTGIGQLSFSDIKQALLFPVLLLIGCSVLSSITSFIQERTMAALSEKITLRVRKEITKKFKTLPMSFLTIIK